MSQASNTSSSSYFPLEPTMEECLESLDVSYETNNQATNSDEANKLKNITNTSNESELRKVDIEEVSEEFEEDEGKKKPSSSSSNRFKRLSKQKQVSSGPKDSSTPPPASNELELFLNTFNAFAQKKSHLNALLKSLTSSKSSDTSSNLESELKKSLDPRQLSSSNILDDSKSSGSEFGSQLLTALLTQVDSDEFDPSGNQNDEYFEDEEEDEDEKTMNNNNASSSNMNTSKPSDEPDEEDLEESFSPVLSSLSAILKRCQNTLDQAAILNEIEQQAWSEHQEKQKDDDETKEDNCAESGVQEATVCQSVANQLEEQFDEDHFIDDDLVDDEEEELSQRPKVQQANLEEDEEEEDEEEDDDEDEEAVAAAVANSGNNFYLEFENLTKSTNLSSLESGLKRMRELKRRYVTNRNKHYDSSRGLAKIATIQQSKTSTSSTSSSNNPAQHFYLSNLSAGTESQGHHHHPQPPAPQFPQFGSNPTATYSYHHTTHNHHHHDEYVLKCQFSALIPAFDPRPGKNNINQIQDISVPSTDSSASPSTQSSDVSKQQSPQSAATRIELYLKVDPNSNSMSLSGLDLIKDEIKLVNKNSTIFQYIQSLIASSRKGESGTLNFERMRNIWDLSYLLIYREVAAESNEDSSNESTVTQSQTETSDSLMNIDTENLNNNKCSVEQILKLQSTILDLIERYSSNTSIMESSCSTSKSKFDQKIWFILNFFSIKIK